MKRSNIRLYPGRDVPTGMPEMNIAALVAAAKKVGVVQGPEVMNRLLTHPDRIPAKWRGKVVLFVDEKKKEDEQGLAVFPCLILLTENLRSGRVYQKSAVTGDYAVAVR